MVPEPRPAPLRRGQRPVPELAPGPAVRSCRRVPVVPVPVVPVPVVPVPVVPGTPVPVPGTRYVPVGVRRGRFRRPVGPPPVPVVPAPPVPVLPEPVCPFRRCPSRCCPVPFRSLPWGRGSAGPGRRPGPGGGLADSRSRAGRLRLRCDCPSRFRSCPTVPPRSPSPERRAGVRIHRGRTAGRRCGRGRVQRAVAARRRPCATRARERARAVTRCPRTRTQRPRPGPFQSRAASSPRFPCPSARRRRWNSSWRRRPAAAPS